MKIVYEVRNGKITEFALIKETEKTFQVNFIRSDGALGGATRVQKIKDDFAVREPHQCRMTISTTDKCAAESRAAEQLEALVSYHAGEELHFKGLLKDLYASM